MRILLINSPFKVKISKDSRWPEYTKSGTLYYPFWLAYATAVIMEKGEQSQAAFDRCRSKKNEF
jgi:anaerobic magnesium-protoporphyrin IX monomethyl ester cyclase